MFPGQCGNTAFFFKSQPDQFHFEFRGIVFPGKSFFSAHEVSTCKISGCLSYRILDSGPDGTQTTLTKVLTYADLKSRFEDPDGREPGRTIELHLTGHMEKFAWSFNGIKFSDAAPVLLKYGERLRITLINDTMMTHPIHLHGMWSDLEDENGNFMVRKHTIDVPPGTKRSYRVTADALGRWAYHCHLLYHMEMGMFREVRVEE